MKRIAMALLLILATLGLNAQVIAHERNAPPNPDDPVFLIADKYFEAAHYGAWDFAFSLRDAQAVLKDELDGVKGVNPKTLIKVLTAAMELRARAELFDSLADALDHTAKAVADDDAWAKEYEGKGAMYKDEVELLRNAATTQVQPMVQKAWEKIFGERMPPISFREATDRLSRLGQVFGAKQ